MTSIRLTRRARSWAAAALASLGAVLAASPVLAGSPLLITGQPMEASELAKLIYPLPTRSIVMKSEATPFGLLVQFDLDSATVKPESHRYLDEVGKMMNLRRLQGKQLMVVGHADGWGSEQYNQALSQQRAAAVGQYLARYHGVELDRLILGGRGESDPIDPSDPYAAENRRVQFHPVD
jgi:OOP family OmpA-OmpF porin